MGRKPKHEIERPALEVGPTGPTLDTGHSRSSLLLVDEVEQPPFQDDTIAVRSAIQDESQLGSAAASSQLQVSDNTEQLGISTSLNVMTCH